MKRWIVLLIMFSCNIAQAQCDAEIKNVIIDDLRGSIIFETEYKLNGKIVDVHAQPCDGCLGRTRYTETTGTKEEIFQLAKEDMTQHCENLIKRIEVNKNNIKTTFLNYQKSLTEPLIPDLRTMAIGEKVKIHEAKQKYKAKEITVTADGSFSVADVVE